MPKKVLLIGYNFYPEPTGIGKYSGEMMYWLARKGYACTVITTYPYYPHWRVQPPYHTKRFRYHTETESFPSGGSLTVHRCPMYVPENPTGLKRMLLDFSFLTSAFFKTIRLLFQEKFAAVITVAPSFQFGLLGLLVKRFHRAKVTYHIQDLQIEAARDLHMIRSKKMIDLLFKLEKYIFRQTDIVSTISDGMAQLVQAKAGKDVLLFPNWADTEQFYPLPDRVPLKAEFGFAPTDKVVLYSGAIGEKQGLEAILHAAKALQSDARLKFVICGSGPYKARLQQLAEALGVPNVVFLPLQPLEKFNAFLNMADVHLVIQKANAGDLVMPSKLTTLLAIGGLCVITANPGSGLYNLAHRYHLALVVEAENQAALNQGIAAALAQPDDTLQRNARAYADQFLSINRVMAAFEAAAL